MANRHLSRSIVMQTLFEWDFASKNSSEVKEILKRNVEEFAPGMGDFSFMEGLLDTVIKKSKDLDRIIEKAAPDWPIDRISIIDRNILRIGLSELLFSDRKEVPPKVAINEAIELAKTFGGETSGKFINGVLGAVYKEMGEPGKDEISKRKKFSPDVPDSQLPVERLAGAIVYAVEKKQIYLALVHDVFGYWTLSKGHLNEKESEEEGVVRVIKEEIGLTISPEEKLGENSYTTFDPEKGKIKKQVVYFLASSPFDDVKLMKEGGLDDVKWFKLSDIITLNFYNDILPLVTKAINILLQKHPQQKK
ncbi:MAG: transcription antitermination factor NusB [Patescibacteria group bacterium]|nr:transcription antitermination factor NusB [bacterium]MDZ4240595.1 transcription antitermination factor NusB [Patescibacteria group bacterium]